MIVFRSRHMYQKKAFTMFENRYVGNLPMNTSEEELRGLFSKCVGYKRLCFRQRPSGPLTKVDTLDLQF